MNRRGFSLVEILVAVCIAAILCTYGTIHFRRYLQNYRSEQQTRLLRGELMKARLTALTQQREVMVQLNTDHFEVYSSSVADASPRSFTLSYPVTWNLVSTKLKFDEKGVSNLQGCICIDGGKGTGAVDSVVILPSRIQIGKLKDGMECTHSDNVTIK